MDIKFLSKFAAASRVGELFFGHPCLFSIDKLTQEVLFDSETTLNFIFKVFSSNVLGNNLV